MAEMDVDTLATNDTIPVHVWLRSDSTDCVVGPRMYNCGVAPLVELDRPHDACSVAHGKRICFDMLAVTQIHVPQSPLFVRRASQ